MNDRLTRLIQVASRALDSGACDTEELLRALRSEGASIVECVRVLCEVQGLGLGEAKKVVDDSRAWRDWRESNQRLRDEAERVATSDAIGDPSVRRAVKIRLTNNDAWEFPGLRPRAAGVDKDAFTFFTGTRF